MRIPSILKTYVDKSYGSPETFGNILFLSLSGDMNTLTRAESLHMLLSFSLNITFPAVELNG